MFRQVIYTKKKDAKQTKSSPCAVHNCAEPSWWQSRGADPTIKTEDYDPYLDPGRKLPIEVALEDEDFRGRLSALQVSSSRTAALLYPASPATPAEGTQAE